MVVPLRLPPESLHFGGQQLLCRVLQDLLLEPLLRVALLGQEGGHALLGSQLYTRLHDRHEFLLPRRPQLRELLLPVLVQQSHLIFDLLPFEDHALPTLWSWILQPPQRRGHPLHLPGRLAGH